MMTSAKVVETSVTITDNIPSQDYTHPDDQTTVLYYYYWQDHFNLKVLGPRVLDAGNRRILPNRRKIGKCISTILMLFAKCHGADFLKSKLNNTPPHTHPHSYVD